MGSLTHRGLSVLPNSPLLSPVFSEMSSYLPSPYLVRSESSGLADEGSPDTCGDPGQCTPSVIGSLVTSNLSCGVYLSIPTEFGIEGQKGSDWVQTQWYHCGRKALYHSVYFVLTVL